MKFKDVFFILVLVLFASILVNESSRIIFVDLTTNYPYLMGFIKVAILATMGELLASRILKGKYQVIGVHLKFIIWGLIGCSFVMVFKLFPSGVKTLQESYLLPTLKKDSFLDTLLFAFLTSTLMNLIFAPTFMALHRFTDTYIELGNGKLNRILKIKTEDVIKNINWNQFIQFIVFKTIPLFWIPAHTITYLLPDVYRVLFSASLSIALGVILSMSKKHNTN